MSEIPPCDLCGSRVAPVYSEPGLRSGRLVKPKRQVAGYRCTNPECDNGDGMPMGWPGLPSRP